VAHRNPISSCDDAVVRARIFLDSLEMKNLFSWPESCRFKGLSKADSPWTLVWEHKVGNLSVADDALRVRVHPQSGSILSLSIRWSKPARMLDVDYDCNHALNVLKNTIADPAVYVESLPLELKSMSKENLEVLEPVWPFKLLRDDSTLAKVLVSAHSGKVIDWKTTNYNGVVKLARGIDEYGAFEEETDFERVVLESNNYNVHSTIVTPSVSALGQQWDDGNVVCFAGHGNYDVSTGVFIECEDQDEFNKHNYPNDFPEDMSQAEIVYTSSCYGGKKTTVASQISRHLVNSSLDAGAKAFFGFAASPYTVQARNYGEYFWSAAGNGLSFGAWQAYAAGFISNVTLGYADASLYGDRSNQLSTEDATWNYYFGEAPSGQERDWRLDDENCWQLDTDLFRFKSIGTHLIIVVVNPTGDEFDVKFTLWRNGMLQDIVDDLGAGGTEVFEYEYSGTHIFSVLIEKAGGSGGVYDLRIYCVLS